MPSKAPIPKKRRLRRVEASLYLKEQGVVRSPRTLAKEHSLGRGPRVDAYDGRCPLFTEEDLDAYAAFKITRDAPTRRHRPDRLKAAGAATEAHSP
jgi:hypothetical protein